jgi:hypothetical protein
MKKHLLFFACWIPALPAHNPSIAQITDPKQTASQASATPAPTTPGSANRRVEFVKR